MLFTGVESRITFNGRWWLCGEEKFCCTQTPSCHNQRYMTDQTTSRQEWLRALPSVDALLRTPTARTLRDTVGAERLTKFARIVTEELRAGIQADAATRESINGAPSRETLLAEAVRMLERESEMKGARLAPRDQPIASLFYKPRRAHSLRQHVAPSQMRQRATARVSMI